MVILSKARISLMAASPAPGKIHGGMPPWNKSMGGRRISKCAALAQDEQYFYKIIYEKRH
jgi:hypothetical protein